jgi:N-carbamoylputrescine amidase
VICFQELGASPYFCQERDNRWLDWAEVVPSSESIADFAKFAKEASAVVVLPLFERDGVAYYNTVVVIDADGSVLGRYRKVHIPDSPHYMEKFYFRPGNLGWPVFETAYARIGVLICYDRHFPEGARALGLQGAELVFVPTATGNVTRPLWEIESRAHAVTNGYFVGSVNRVGVELDREIAFYGSSYMCDPWGATVAAAGEDEEVLLAEVDLSMVRPRAYYYRDRRPETYGALVEP